MHIDGTAGADMVGEARLLGWLERQTALASLAERQLFLIGGAPRSGTTWLQQMLDTHPEVSCRGEALFQQHLANPMDRLIADRRQAIEAKNSRVFRHAGGYGLPEAADADFLIGSAMLLALHRQCQGEDYRAIGEKTPENVFFFPRFKALFPASKLICIARDPRDVLTSAWHFFHQAQPGEDERTAKIAFIRSAFPSLNEGARAIMTLVRQYPTDCMMVTYEDLRLDPAPVLARLFAFLGVADSRAIVDASVAATTFETLTGGRPAGTEHTRSFLRNGVVGGWSHTLDGEMSRMIMHELGWMFAYFGWSE